jgi:hypothetical protein
MVPADDSAAETGETPHAANQRQGGDERRQRPTPMMSRWIFRGRRRSGRRDGEREKVYVDRPGAWVIAAFSIVVALSIMDAGFTLYLLKRGATEANPVMRAALHLGDHAFILIKTSMTILAAGFLMLHKNWPLGRVCLALALFGYSALTLYHLYAQKVV